MGAVSYCCINHVIVRFLFRTRVVMQIVLLLLSSRAVTDKGEPFILIAMYLDEEIQAEIRQMIEPIFEPTRNLTDGDLCEMLITKLGL